MVELKTFVIGGVETTDTTHRTIIVESIVPIAGRTFVDLGAATGYEARAIARRGAAMSVAVEGKDFLYENAREAAEVFGQPNHRVVKADVRRIDEYDLGPFDVTMCFGLLYHMTNPFNLLKRIAHITRDTLLLETHVAPSPWAEHRLREKHRGALMSGTRQLYMDGALFEGRVCVHRANKARTTGSLDEDWTFWLTQESLMKALTRAGFDICAWHHEIDPQTPPAIAGQGAALGFGHANTKIFAVCRVDPARRVPITPGTLSSAPDRIVTPEFRETLWDAARYHSRRVMRRLGLGYRPKD